MLGILLLGVGISSITAMVATGVLNRRYGNRAINAILAGISFLVEGALLDWGALLVTEGGLLPVAQGGMGYMFFSIAMTVGRFSGDAMSARFGDRQILWWDGAAALAGFVLLLTASTGVPACAGTTVMASSRVL